MSGRARGAARTLAAGFAARIVAWQKAHGRHDLPWQRREADDRRDPYRVWLSEVMLQQTQVQTVRPYFERFLVRFPDVAALAAAEEGDVLALWSGLGYYTRARMLHRAARAIATEHGGRFPTTSPALETLPGVGRSTAAAIAAFSFGERAAILDGNVKRVLTRVLAFGRDLAEPKAIAALWREAEALLPLPLAGEGGGEGPTRDDDIAAYTQGLMDLGATVCLPRSPHCLLCPVADLCVAARTGTQSRYPVKSRRAKRSARETVWLELRWRGQVFLVERERRGIWPGLWSLPEFASLAAFESAASQWPGHGEALEPFTHVLTHLEWRLVPIRWTLPSRTARRKVGLLVAAWPSGRWFGLADALALGLPAPLRKRIAAEASGRGERLSKGGGTGAGSR